MESAGFIFDSGNGCFVESPGVPLSDRGFRFGMHVFETIAVYRGRLLLAEMHRDLMASAVQAVGFPSPPVLWVESVKRLAAGFPDGVLRVFVTAGDGVPTPSVQSPRIFAFFEKMVIDADALPPAGSAGFVESAAPSLPWLKSGNYWSRVLMQSDVEERGYSDAVLTTHDGWITSAAMANFFAVIDGRVVTPQAEPGVRSGVLREWMIRNHSVETRRLHRDDVARASECFLTNSRVGIRPLDRVEKFLFPECPMARSLWDCYRREVINGPV
jgi:branched-subunit amino acid aminotransferase/4-amino-4-deoxychorismate lyase